MKMELLGYERSRLSPEDAEKRMQLRQDIKEYKRLITLIDIEMYRGAIEIMDGMRARAEAVLALNETERSYEGLIKKP